MSAPRTLESFSKQDLVEFIKKRSLWWGQMKDQGIRDLAWIEYERKTKELGVKMDALQVGMAECRLPQDWRKYKSLSDQWDAAQRARDRLYKGLK